MHLEVFTMFIKNFVSFQYNGKDITWNQLVSLFKENQPFFQEGSRVTTAPLGVLNPIPKITPRHLYLTPTLRMKVKLATQVKIIDIFISNCVKLIYFPQKAVISK